MKQNFEKESGEKKALPNFLALLSTGGYFAYAICMAYLASQIEFPGAQTQPTNWDNMDKIMSEHEEILNKEIDYYVIDNCSGKKHYYLIYEVDDNNTKFYTCELNLISKNFEVMACQCIKIKKSRHYHNCSELERQDKIKKLINKKSLYWCTNDNYDSKTRFFNVDDPSPLKEKYDTCYKGYLDENETLDFCTAFKKNLRNI